MGKLTLILGGARSGKSTKAEEMAKAVDGSVAFVATAEARDGEMRLRIARHRAARPAGWTTIEEPLDLSRAVEEAANGRDAVVVDCLTLWVSNLLCGIDSVAGTPGWQEQIDRLEERLRGEVARIAAIARETKAELILVSNEVGLGLVPDNALGRVYRDLLGMVNRLMAAEASSVLLMVAGLAVDVKRLAEAAGDGSSWTEVEQRGQ